MKKVFIEENGETDALILAKDWRAGTENYKYAFEVLTLVNKERKGGETAYNG